MYIARVAVWWAGGRLKSVAMLMPWPFIAFLLW